MILNYVCVVCSLSTVFLLSLIDIIFSEKNDIVNNASGNVLEEDHVEHNVVVEAHYSTDELQNIDLDYNSNQRDVGKAATKGDENRLVN